MNYLRYFKLFCLLCLFAVTPSAARDTSHTIENGEWGVLFYPLQSQSPGLYWISPDGKYLDQIVSNATLQTKITGFASPFGLSPDGETLIFAGDESHSNYMTGTYMFDLETSNISRTNVYNQELQFGHVWSPDGKWVVYCTITANPGERRIEVINVETQQSQVVIPNSLSFQWGTSQAGTLDCARWLPNENRLVFSALVILSSINTYYAVFAVNIDGSDLQQLTPDNVDVRLPLGVGNFVVDTPYGTHVYYLCMPADDLLIVHQICRMNLATSAIEQVVDLNEFGISAQRTLIPSISNEIVEDQSSVVMNITGQVIARFAVSPDGKIAIELSDLEHIQSTIELFDPYANQLTALTEGISPEWFYRQIRS